MVCLTLQFTIAFQPGKKGTKFTFFSIHGEPYVRIDQNKVNQDYLEDILEVESLAIPEPEEATPEQIAKLESKI
jgi:hypothetical protein